jgi:dTDP-glucose pyrophosphorylase
MEKNWSGIVVAPTTPLRETLSVIDAGALRLALVVDEHGVLLGTLSDGDVRRALIHGLSLSEPVSRAMNRQPRTVPSSADREEVFAIMDKHDLLVIPVVNDQSRLVGLFSHKELLHSVQKDNWVFLMAGGYGTRLRPFTDQCPKPMLKVGNKPLLQTILEGYLAAGFHKFYISVHYMAEAITSHFGDGSRWNATIRYVEEKSPLGTAGSLGLLPTVDDQPLLMMNGDVLTKVDFAQLLSFHEENGSDLTMCVREFDFTVPYGVVETSGRSVTKITEKPVHKFFVNAGIYVLSPRVVAEVTGCQKLDMPDLTGKLVAEGRDVSVFPIHEYWLDIGRPDDFARAQEEMGGMDK